MSNTTYIKWISRTASRHWWVFVFLALLTVFSVAITLLGPVPLAFMADYVFGNSTPPKLFGVNLDIPKEQLLILVVIGYFAIYIFSNIYSGLRALLERKLLQVAEIKLFNEVFESSMTIPYNHPKRAEDGEYVYSITSRSLMMSSLLFTNFSTLFQSTLTIISILAILLMTDWKMTLFTMLTAPILFLVVHYFSARIEKKADAVQATETKIYNFVSSSLAKIKTIQKFGLERRRSSELTEIVKESNRADIKLLLVNHAYLFATEATILAAISGIILFGGTMVLHNALTFGILLLYVNYVSSMSDPLVTIAQTIGSIREQAIGVKRAHEVISLANETELKSGTLKDVALKGLLTFEHVYYSVNDVAVADDITETFTPGAVYVITGPSGSGKSTLLSMIQRFVHPSSGRICIDGIDIRELDVGFLRSKVAVVDQEPELFGGSIQENIMLADPTRPFSLLYVVAAASMSGSDEFIEHLPGKYDSNIDDGKLSGGQKQRIAIARASYRQAPIIIMDEPTSALDKHSADIFLQNLTKNYGDRTVLIVTHDQDVVRRFATTAFVLQDGHLSRYMTADPS